jgi:hypothetical protein
MTQVLGARSIIARRTVNDRSVWCKMYIREVLCATCISWNMGHKILLALRRDPTER